MLSIEICLESACAAAPTMQANEENYPIAGRVC